MKLRYIVPLRMRRIFFLPAYFDKAGVRGVRRKFWKDIFFYVYSLLLFFLVKYLLTEYFFINYKSYNLAKNLNLTLIYTAILIFLLSRLCLIVMFSGNVLVMSNSRRRYVAGVSDKYGREKIFTVGGYGVYFDQACFVFRNWFHFRFLYYSNHSFLPNSNYRRVLIREFSNVK